MNAGINSQKLRPGFFWVVAEESTTALLVFSVDMGVCHFCNALAHEVLEFPRSPDYPLNSFKIEDLFVTEGRGTIRPFNQEVVQREGLTQDVLMKKKSGGTLIANVGIKHLQLNATEKVYLVMIQDVTFQKKLQRELTLKQEEIRNAYAELLEQNKQLKELDAAKDRFIALTTHELRTPLSAIVATSEVLTEKLYENEEQMSEFIRTVYEQSLHLMDLVNDILDFSKIRAGKMEYHVDLVDIRDMIKKIVANFQHMATTAHVQIIYEMPEEPFSCYVDITRLKEVLNNIVSNAIKYNRIDGTVTVLLSRVEGEEFIRIAIADTGQGIPADRLESVFNEFETAGSISQHHKGTGLGMPIAKRLTEAMGGRMKLESELHVGTTFTVEFPTTKILDESMYQTKADVWDDFSRDKAA